ncbi:hypothetical protein [Cupriavidus metallidurans]|uniref:hypothetical protein n=1 Tax=Cupriavidus metallidurans TaxID=119219 RepID=UPI000565DE52|nr:hypothetical protein [Cupriavidus metallidurans]
MDFNIISILVNGTAQWRQARAILSPLDDSVLMFCIAPRGSGTGPAHETGWNTLVQDGAV